MSPFRKRIMNSVALTAGHTFLIFQRKLQTVPYIRIKTKLSVPSTVLIVLGRIKYPPQL